MFTPDEKATCLKQIQNAYQTLELYEKMKKEEKDTEDFAETTFSLNAYAIAEIAKTMGFSSKVKEQLDEQSRENRERQKRIQTLENQLSSQTNATTYQEHVKTVFEQIESTWKEEGFTGTYQPSISQYGEVSLSLQLEPIHDIMDIWMEEADEKKAEELFQVRRRSFFDKEFDVIQDSSYVFVLDNDENKRNIQTLLTHLFPTVTIDKWDSRKQRDVFILWKVDVSLKSLQFLEETI